MSPIMRVLLFVLTGSLIAACGAASGPTQTPMPSLTPFPTFEFIPPTAPAAFSGAADAEEGEAEIDPVLVERGQGRYEALECAACHEENGEGTDDGSSLLEFDMTETDFIDFMRSGGELGSDHQYSTDRLSRSGGENLYLYLMTLASESE